MDAELASDIVSRAAEKDFALHKLVQALAASDVFHLK